MKRAGDPTPGSATARDVLAWGRDLPGFTEQHARHGAGFARLVFEAAGDQLGEVPADAPFLLAVDTACCALWIDDLFDGAARGEGEAPPLAGFIRPANAPGSHAARGFASLCERFAGASPGGEAFELWRRTALDTFRAYDENVRVCREKKPCSYAEYLANGEDGIAAVHLLAGVALRLGLDMPRRMAAGFARTIRSLSCALRLQNDLASVGACALRACARTPCSSWRRGCPRGPRTPSCSTRRKPTRACCCGTSTPPGSTTRSRA